MPALDRRIAVFFCRTASAVLHIFVRTTPMTEHSLWRLSRAIHRALTDSQYDELESVLDENIEWTIYGPIDMFGFFGTHRGKAAVIAVIRQIAGMIRLIRFDREAVMLGEDTAASMMPYTLAAKSSGQSISVRLAQFAQFKGGRLTNMRVLIDTFDLVEQVLGRAIHLPKIA
jgi:ketosteroid isomerase-like protein